MGCYNDDVLFIHIPKTGGWSCKQYMRDNLHGVLMPDDPESKLPIGHIRLADIHRFTGRDLDTFTLIIAVLRDPYEQQLSQWSFWRDRYARGERHVHDYIAATYPTLERFLSDPRCDFNVWYDQHIGFKAGDTPAEQQAAKAEAILKSSRAANRYELFGGYYRYWLEVDGTIPDNVTICYHERLAADFTAALKPYIDGTPPPMPTLNASPSRRKTREYYTPQAAAMVEAKFDWAFNEHYQKWLYSGRDE